MSFRTTADGVVTTRGRVAVVAAAVGIALSAGCATTTDPNPAGSAGVSPKPAVSPSPSACRPSIDQQKAIAGLRVKGPGDYVPDGVRATGTTELTGDCTPPADWEAKSPSRRSPTPVAAVRYDYVAATALTAQNVVDTFGAQATRQGWDRTGRSDDSTADGGDGSAYAWYCQKVEGTWAQLTIERHPGPTGNVPLMVFVETYPTAVSCPGRPTDG